MTGRARTVAVFFSAVLVNLGMLYYRRPDSFYNPQFLAEDGKIFFADAYNQGAVSLFNTTSGYFHLLPRFVSISSLAFDIPYHHIPAVFNYVCVLVYFLLWFYIFKRLDLSLPARFFIALATILTPIGNEIVINQTNIQWFLVFFPVIIFCGKQPESVWERILDGVMLLFSVFTGPHIIIVLPALLIVSYFNREHALKRYSFFMICFAGAASCLISLLYYGSVDRTGGEFQILNYGFAQMFFYQYYFPLLSIGIHDVPRWLVFILSAVCIVALLMLLRHIIRVKNEFALVSFLAGMLFLITTIITYRKDPVHMSPINNCIRNFYLPMVFLLWSLIAITRFNSAKIIIWSALFLWFVVQTILFIPLREYQDLKWGAYADQIDKVDSLTIPINPAGWEMTLIKPQPSN